MESSEKPTSVDPGGKALLERIEQVRQRLHLSKAAFCRLIRYDPRRYGNMFSRGDAPSVELVQGIVGSTDVDVQWLLTGRVARGYDEARDQMEQAAEQLRSAHTPEERERARQDFLRARDDRIRAEGRPNGVRTLEGAGVIDVPVLNVELAAGHGAHPPEIEETRETRPFREADLRRLSTHPANLTIVQVTGTSMEPLLHAGDEVMVDFTAPITLRDGLYALRLGDALLIKHVQRLTGGRIALRSENPIYEPIEIDLAQEPDDFQVLGRVVWGARRY